MALTVAARGANLKRESSVWVRMGGAVCEFAQHSQLGGSKSDRKKKNRTAKIISAG